MTRQEERYRHHMDVARRAQRRMGYIHRRGWRTLCKINPKIAERIIKRAYALHPPFSRRTDMLNRLNRMK